MGERGQEAVQEILVLLPRSAGRGPRRDKGAFQSLAPEA